MLMKKIAKRILALSMAVAMLLGMTITALAAEGTTVYLKSMYGGMDKMVSISNVVSIENMKYIEGQDLPTYLCDSPVEVKLFGALGITVYRVPEENLEKVKKGEVVQLQEIPWEKYGDTVEQPKLRFWYDELPEIPEIKIPDDVEQKPTYILDEKGIYLIHANTSRDYIKALVIVDGGNTGNAAPTPATVQAKPTASSVLVNGKQTAFDAYNIGGNNYFKLR
ncbi:MAG: hypothetical protein GX949_02795, partial [Peptococcaceae bacterium]|nr:hypothetical protein [Peptococcaceae bacterium]